MKKLLMTNSFSRSVFLLSLIATVAIGCSKKEKTSAIPEAPPQETPQAAQPTVAQPGAPQEMQVTAQPAAQDVPLPKVALTEAQAAIKAKNFDRAKALLLTNPRTPVQMTGDQLISHNKAVGDLYREASAAAAAGDPKAKAVLEQMKKEFAH